MLKCISALCTLITLAGASLSSLHAETIYALSETANGPVTVNTLLRFDSAAPGVITTSQRITGLSGFPTDLAIRPADGQLYTEVGTNVYRIDPATAQATLLLSNAAFSSQIVTAAFNPVMGLLRVISTRGENQPLSFRVNVDTGAVIQDGISPGQPRGLAYTNNYAGANTTTLYTFFGDGLSIDNPENQSQFTTVGRIGVPGASDVLSSLSISGLTGTAYASLTYGGGTPGPYSSQFYMVDLNTGAGTLVGPIGNGTLFVEAIAAPVGPSQVAPVPEPRSWGLLGVGLLLGGALRRFRPCHC